LPQPTDLPCSLGYALNRAGPVPKEPFSQSSLKTIKSEEEDDFLATDDSKIERVKTRRKLGRIPKVRVVFVFHFFNTFLPVS
jgi:hypothetical protein